MEQVEQPKEVAAETGKLKYALPRSGVDFLIKIINGFAVASDGGGTKVSTQDVAAATGILLPIIGRNTPFLVASGIVIPNSSGFYIPNEKAVRFARGAAWNEPNAKAHLRELALPTWYGHAVQQIFALQPAIDRAELMKALGAKSGATDGDSASLGYLIDFIVFTGLMDADENGSLTRGEFGQADSPQRLPIPTGPHATLQPAKANLSLVIHLHVNKLEDLTPENANRITQWLQGLRDSVHPIEVELGTKEV